MVDGERIDCMLSVEFASPVDIAWVLPIASSHMRRLPKACRDYKRIDTAVLPPAAFISAPVQITMMQPAHGNGEPVANFASHRRLFRELDVMGAHSGEGDHAFRCMATT